MSFVRLCRLFHICITRLLWFTYVLYVYIIQNGDYSERPRLVCYWLCKISSRRNTILCFHGTHSLFQAFRVWSAALNRAGNEDERGRERVKTVVGGVGSESEGTTQPTPALFFVLTSLCAVPQSERLEQAMEHKTVTIYLHLFYLRRNDTRKSKSKVRYYLASH